MSKPVRLPVRLPIRASRWVSVSRQLLIVGPPLVVIFLASVGIAALSTLGAGLCCLVPGLPLGIVLGARVARAVDYWFDSRRPCVVLDGRVLSVSMPDGSRWQLDLDQPYTMASGWWSHRLNLPPTGNVRDYAECVHLYLAQDGREVLLYSEDGLSSSRESGVPCRYAERMPEAQRRVWADDLMALILTLRPPGAGP